LTDNHDADSGGKIKEMVSERVWLLEEITLSRKVQFVRCKPVQKRETIWKPGTVQFLDSLPTVLCHTDSTLIVALIHAQHVHPKVMIPDQSR